jgi:hypothetical protein
MEIVIDNWEGSGDIDEPTIVDNNVAGVITRINDIQGGLHLDTNFIRQWGQNAAFQLQSVYSVYNPWVDGATNWLWLKSQLPSNCPARIFIDVEVRYSGTYLPSTYASQVDWLINAALDKGYTPSIYTGYGYLGLLSLWRKNIDYWWARYPFVTMPSRTPHTWEDLWTKLRMVNFATADLVGASHVSPGPVKLWQLSGDAWILPGCAGHAMDISIWPGTLDELKTWWGVKPTIPVDKVAQLKADISAVLAKY